MTTYFALNLLQSSWIPHDSSFSKDDFDLDLDDEWKDELESATVIATEADLPVLEALKSKFGVALAPKLKPDQLQELEEEDELIVLEHQLSPNPTKPYTPQQIKAANLQFFRYTMNL